MKRISVMLAGGVPVSFLADPCEVGRFREYVRNGGLYHYGDFDIACRNVVLFAVTDPDEDEGKTTEEDGCNS